MAPIIRCVRHAQGFHNLGSEFHGLPDPVLTPLGEDQCATLRSSHLIDQSRITLVTASPLSRTLHTASLVFEPALKNGQCRNQILALPDAQETSDFPCDTGSDVDVLTKTCADRGWAVDLSLVKPGWNHKTLDNRYSPASDAIKSRAKDARKQIRQLARDLVAAGHENPEIVLVSHGGYLHYFTQDWEDSARLNGTSWANTETRAYTFKAGIANDDDTNADLVETTESRQARGKHTPLPDTEAQKILFKKTMQGWEAQGLQNPSKIGLPTPNPEGQEPAAKNMSVDERTGEVEVVA